ncbi:PREDICTED: protein FAM177A1-like [Branchiostoma belcheri]|uniref:Protein FAM177A1-like n=1 Tax=Branchiostoma belcheri TaxID=7741 RepID=A0A6P4Z8V2_BRABE|nr:PREDICTED: protein FAM177A1-like [Branchiostoma belcheri]
MTSPPEITKMASSGVSVVATDDVLLQDKRMDDAQGFHTVSLDEHLPDCPAHKKKQPRRVLHCSDGIYEEYSTDEEDETDTQQPEVDPKTLTWGPYLWFYTTFVASRGLAACDFLGEKLAWFFGITSPKYQYAIDEYERMQRQDKEEQEEAEREAEAERQRANQQAAEQVNDMEGGATATKAEQVEC